MTRYQKNLKKVTTLVALPLVALSLVFSGLFMPDYSYAQTTSDEVQASGEQLFCKRDFSNFLSNGIDFDGEGFWDYWGDIIDIPWVGASRYSANLCHYMEIDSLLRRIDTVRKQLRQAFYVCDRTTSTKLTATYYELSAELYYLRHFIDTKPGNIINVRPDLEMRTEFIEKFGPGGKNYFSTTQATVAMYEKFKNKYTAKLSSYQNCEDSNIAALKLKIQDLAGILDDLQKIGQRFEQRVENRNKLVDQRIKQNSMFSAENGADFINKALDFRINGDDITDPTVWEQITSGQSDFSQELAKNSPSGVSSYTFFDAEEDIIYGQTRDANKALDLIYSSEYELMYKNTGDQISSESVLKLEELKSIIEGSYPHLKELGACTGSIVEKQCAE